MPVIAALEGGPVTRGTLDTRTGLPDATVAQRLTELRRMRVVEVVPENGDLRLAPEGRRLLQLLRDLEDWAASGRGGPKLS